MEDLGMGTTRMLVEDVMVVDSMAVSRDATLEEADMLVRSTFVSGLPVNDLDGVLVGVIGDAQLAAHRFVRPMDSFERGSAKSASAT